MKLLKPITSPKIYFPGLISIIVLPIACYLFLSIYQVKYAIPVSWFDQQAVERLDSVHHQQVDLENFRKYQRLYLTGFKAHDNLELDKLREAIPFITTRYGLTNGICIYLTPKTKYQDMVTALDICNYHTMLSVIPLNDQIFVFKYNEAGDVLWRKNIRLPPHDALTSLDLPEAPLHSKSLADDLYPFWPCLIPLFGMFFFWSRRTRWQDEMPKKVRHDVK